MTNIGIGPSGLQTGDVIYNPDGSKMPVIMRSKHRAQTCSLGKAPFELPAKPQTRRFLAGSRHGDAGICRETPTLHQFRRRLCTDSCGEVARLRYADLDKSTASRYLEQHLAHRMPSHHENRIQNPSGGNATSFPFPPGVHVTKNSVQGPGIRDTLKPVSAYLTEVMWIGSLSAVDLMTLLYI